MKYPNLFHRLIGLLDHKKLFAIFTIISSLYIFLASRYATIYCPMFFPDSIGYMEDGVKIFNNWSTLLTTSYSIIYPFLIACGLNMGFSLDQSAIISINLAYALLIIPLFYLGKEISNEWVSVASCIIFLISADFLKYGTCAMTEMIYLFFSICSILFLVLYVKYNTGQYIFISGIFSMLSALARPFGVILILTGFCTILISSYAQKNKLIRDFSLFSLSLLPYIYWIYNIKKRTGSSLGGYSNVLVGYWPGSSTLAAIERFIDKAKANAFYSGSDSIIILTLIIFVISIIYIYKRDLLLRYANGIYPIYIYVITYLIILFLITSDIWFGYARIQTRYIDMVIPFIILIIFSTFHFVHEHIGDTNRSINKRIIKLTLSILLMIAIVQQINIYQPTIGKIRASSEECYYDSCRLNDYISKQNLKDTDYVYFDVSHSYMHFYPGFKEQIPNIKLGYIISFMPNETILDNLTTDAYSLAAYGNSGIDPARTLADLIKRNKNSPIYIITPLEVAQSYMENPPKDVCLINPVKFSNSFICMVALKSNGSCNTNPFPRDYLLDSGSSITTALAGDFTGKKHDQLLILKSNPSENILQILDFAKGSPVRVGYDDRPGTAWLNANHSLLSGDFMDLGYDQAFHIERHLTRDKIVIEDFNQGKAPAIIRYSDVLANNSALKNLADAEDAQLAGDFLGLGYSQVLFIDRNPKGGKLVIADFSEGKTPEMIEYSKIEGNSTLLSSLLDDQDKQFSGDFMSLGHSQLLMINCNHTGAKEPKIIIADFSKGKKSASLRYQENWGESSSFGGWLDADDTQLVGDFMGLGHSQVLLINHDSRGGKIMIADFSRGKPPANIKYWENWGQGTIFRGWLGINDTKVAGDFKGFGYSQVLFINDSINGSNATIVEFLNGKPEIAM